MDIRSFFGGKGSQSQKKSTQADSVTASDGTANKISSDSVSSEETKTNSLDAVVQVQPELNIPQCDTQIKESVIPADLQGIITWSPGEPVPYAAVAATFDKIAANPSRLAKESALTKLYRAVTLTTPEDLCDVVYLTSNKVFPAYDGMELGIGEPTSYLHHPVLVTLSY